MDEIKLGMAVTDTQTGFSGITTARIEYLHGDKQFLVEKLKNDGDGVVSEWVRADRLYAAESKK